MRCAGGLRGLRPLRIDPPSKQRLRRLKLRDLDILMAVIETGSMGNAADRLNISQPAISKAIVALEDAQTLSLLCAE
jgi:DNA-binding MarR family transcriptional regulator